MKQKEARVTELLLYFSFQLLDLNDSQAQGEYDDLVAVSVGHQQLQSCRAELMGKDKLHRDGSA